MPDNQKKIIPIDYTHREFESIKRDLEGVAKGIIEIVLGISVRRLLVL